MLNHDERLDLDTTVPATRPTAADGAIGATRAVALVVLCLAALAMAGYSVLFMLGGELLAIIPLFVGIAIVSGIVLVVALLAAVPLGALLARANAVMAAVLVAPLAGFLVPFAMFQDEGFAAGCGAVSILVGFIFATDNRFKA